MVTIDSIKETFKRMENDGVNTKAALLWGFFFMDKKKEKLEGIKTELSAEGYNFGDLYPDDSGNFWLKMEKIIIHDPQSLFEVCQKFYILAERHRVESFDGYDVGNPDSNKPVSG